MLEKTRAELVLVEPGASRISACALGASSEQNHVLLLGGGESLGGFDDRARRRAFAMQRASQHLCQITYLVGSPATGDWAARKQLLLGLCEHLAPDGILSVFAQSSASGEVLECMGDLQLRLGSGVQLRAVFSDDSPRAAEAPRAVAEPREREERSGVRHARPRPSVHGLAAVGT